MNNLGTENALFEIAEKRLPDATEYGKRNRNKRHGIRLMHADHKVKPADIVDVFFHAVLKDERDIKGDYEWQRGKVRIRTALAGKEKELGIRPPRVIENVQEKESYVKVSPSAQGLIDKHKLDAEDIPGTGANGAIIKRDVVAFIEATK